MRSATHAQAVGSTHENVSSAHGQPSSPASMSPASEVSIRTTFPSTASSLFATG